MCVSSPFVGAETLATMTFEQCTQFCNLHMFRHPLPTSSFLTNTNRRCSAWKMACIERKAHRRTGWTWNPIIIILRSYWRSRRMVSHNLSTAHNWDLRCVNTQYVITSQLEASRDQIASRIFTVLFCGFFVHLVMSMCSRSGSRCLSWQTM